MAPATSGSSKTLPHRPTPRLVVSAMLHLKYRWLITWKNMAARFERERETSDFVNDQQAWSGEESHGGRPAAFERGAVTSGCGVRGGGVVLR